MSVVIDYSNGKNFNNAGNSHKFVLPFLLCTIFGTKFTWIIVIKIFAISLPSQPFLGHHHEFHVFYYGFLEAPHFFTVWIRFHFFLQLHAVMLALKIFCHACIFLYCSQQCGDGNLLSIIKRMALAKSRLTVVSCKAKKCDHFCESFTWSNGFAIFKNILALKSAWQNLWLTKGFTLHITLYHRHKIFVLVLYTTRSFRPVCTIAFFDIALTLL